MLRRVLLIAICLAPVALAVASMLAAPRPASTGAMIAVAFGLLTAAFNFYLSFIRPRRHEKFVSGAPLAGTIAVVVALLWSFGSTGIAIASLVVLALDTGGLPWFLGVMLWHRE